MVLSGINFCSLHDPANHWSSCFVHLQPRTSGHWVEFRKKLVGFINSLVAAILSLMLLPISQVQVKFKLVSSRKTHTCVWSRCAVFFFNGHCYVINNIRTLIINGWGFPLSSTSAVNRPLRQQLSFNFARMLVTENAKKKEQRTEFCVFVWGPNRNKAVGVGAFFEGERATGGKNCIVARLTAVIDFLPGVCRELTGDSAHNHRYTWDKMILLRFRPTVGVMRKSIFCVFRYQNLTMACPHILSLYQRLRRLRNYPSNFRRCVSLVLQIILVMYHYFLLSQWKDPVLLLHCYQ